MNDAAEPIARGPLAVLVASLAFASCTMLAPLDRYEAAVDCDMKAPLWITLWTGVSVVMAIAFVAWMRMRRQAIPRGGVAALILIAGMLLIRGAQCRVDVARAERECHR
jgi:hypothetical protein